MAEWEAPLEKVKGRVETLQATLNAHVESENQRWEQQEEKNRMFQETINRPSWAVTVIISVLSSATVGLGVLLFK